MSKNFTANQKVWDSQNRERTGLVIGRSAIAFDLIAVEWDDGELTRTHEDDLLLEEDMKLELEFKAINDKIKQSAALLADAARDANKLGKSFGDYNYDTDEEYFPATNELKRAMRDGGWHTSSLSC